jgi:hypothetical protein
MLLCADFEATVFVKIASSMLYTCSFRVAWQTDGATPLLIASEKGFAECVRALLDRGMPINQAAVGCTVTMARPFGGCVCGEPECTHAFAACWVRWGGTRSRGDRALQ